MNNQSQAKKTNKSQNQYSSNSSNILNKAIVQKKSGYNNNISQNITNTNIEYNTGPTQKSTLKINSTANESPKIILTEDSISPKNEFDLKNIGSRGMTLNTDFGDEISRKLTGNFEAKHIKEQSIENNSESGNSSSNQSSISLDSKDNNKKLEIRAKAEKKTIKNTHREVKN